MHQDICIVESCIRKSEARQMCSAHYQRFQEGRPLGTPLQERGRAYSTPEEAFAARTRWNGECLEWTGSMTRAGYGRISANGRTVRVHRWAYEHFHGPIPEGMYVDHACGNRACCSAEHLRAVTPAQNSQNVMARRSNNKSGHRGVQWSNERGKWRVQVKASGKLRSGGYFDSIEDAAEAAKDLREKWLTHTNENRREVARLPFVEEASVLMRRVLGEAEVGAIETSADLMQGVVGEGLNSLAVKLDLDLHRAEEIVKGNGNVTIGTLARVLKASGYTLELRAAPDPDPL